MQKENLPASVQLTLDRIADHPLIVLRNDGLHWKTVVRGRLDGAHVTGSRQSQVKCAGNGSGTKREDIHQFAEHLEPFLVKNAEPLFLVDDHKPEVFEFNVSLDQSVRADNDIH